MCGNQNKFELNASILGTRMEKKKKNIYIIKSKIELVIFSEIEQNIKDAIKGTSGKGEWTRRMKWDGSYRGTKTKSHQNC